MKRFSTIALVLLLVAVFSLPASASAATSPGVKPGSFFYFFDTTFEKIGLFFIFSPEKKTKKVLEYADERLAEIEATAEEKNPDAIKMAIANYENNIAFATEKSKEVKDKGQAESLLASIEDNASKNQEVLFSVLTKVPEKAKGAIMQAIKASIKVQEEAAKQIVDLKDEVEQLKKEVEELKKKQSTTGPAPKQLAPTTQNSQEQRKSEEKLKTTTVKLSNLNSFIDATIANYEGRITYAKENIESTEFYDNNFLNSRILTSSLNQTETDTKIKEGYELLIDMTDAQIKYNEKVRNNLLANIKNMEVYIASLKNEKEKNLLSDPVSVERYWAYYDELKKLIVVDQYTTTLVNNYDAFVSKTKKFQSDVRLVMTLINARADANYRAQMSTIKNEQDSLHANVTSQPTYIYTQPVVYPQIQMPQTTHCTMGTIGGSGVELVINCSTSGF